MCKVCKVKNCEGKVLAKGYCAKHYKQQYRYGDLLERTIYDPNEIIEYDDYAEVIIYNKQCKEIARAIIDLDDIARVKQHKWSYHNGYVINRKFNLSLHRFIMNNPSDDVIIDHINRNPLDNRKCNLRPCSSQENCMNKGIQSNNSSGFPGVSYKKDKNKWKAYISINRRQIYLGYFDCIEDAIKARKQAEIDYFGEFSPNNEI